MFEHLVCEGGDDQVALVVDFENDVPTVSAYATIPSLDEPVLAATYLSAPETASNSVYSYALASQQLNPTSDYAPQSESKSNARPPVLGSSREAGYTPNYSTNSAPNIEV